jgi:thymidylate kinase|tara:strand:- start:3742 stop:4314 length:573 start_codon:yes stop_codon:yes gene_type:complete
MKKHPLIISFMGVDGSGKTTLSKKIKKDLKQSVYLHLKPYILFQDKRNIIKNPHNNKKSFFISSVLRLLSWLISYKIYFFKNKSNKFYIFDRFAHDILIDPLRYKHNLSKNLTRFILNFFPRPDLWIFLNPSLKIIKSRKQELPDIELKRQIKEYSIFFKNKKNVLILNTNTKTNSLIKKIKKKMNSIKK